MACAVLFNFNKKDDNGKDLETVRLAEVAHSIFYAPMYVAIEEGYFEEVGIDIELSLLNGADKVSAAVLSGMLILVLQEVKRLFMCIMVVRKIILRLSLD